MAISLCPFSFATCFVRQDRCAGGACRMVSDWPILFYWIVPRVISLFVMVFKYLCGHMCHSAHLGALSVLFFVGPVPACHVCVADVLALPPTGYWILNCTASAFVVVSYKVYHFPVALCPYFLCPPSLLAMPPWKPKKPIKSSKFIDDEAEEDIDEMYVICSFLYNARLMSVHVCRDELSGDNTAR